MVLLQRETATAQGLVREFVNKNKGSELALEIVWIEKKRKPSWKLKSRPFKVLLNVHIGERTFGIRMTVPSIVF